MVRSIFSLKSLMAVASSKAAAICASAASMAEHCPARAAFCAARTRSLPRAARGRNGMGGTQFVWPHVCNVNGDDSQDGNRIEDNYFTAMARGSAAACRESGLKMDEKAQLRTA
jgi:hypothetical protein